MQVHVTRKYMCMLHVLHDVSDDGHALLATSYYLLLTTLLLLLYYLLLYYFTTYYLLLTCYAPLTTHYRVTDTRRCDGHVLKIFTKVVLLLSSLRDDATRLNTPATRTRDNNTERGQCVEAAGCCGRLTALANSAQSGASVRT